MSDFSYLLSSASEIVLQTGFTRETETVTPAMLAGKPSSQVTFFLIPSGPVLFSSASGAPLAAGTLNIAESDDPADIIHWMNSGSNGAVIRSFTLQVGQTFKQFIPVNGPFVGLQVVGTSVLNVEADGLIGWAPSTIMLGPTAFVNNNLA